MNDWMGEGALNGKSTMFIGWLSLLLLLWICVFTCQFHLWLQQTSCFRHRQPIKPNCGRRSLSNPLQKNKDWNFIRSIFSCMSWDLVISMMKWLIWTFFFLDCILFLTIVTQWKYDVTIVSLEYFFSFHQVIIWVIWRWILKQILKVTDERCENVWIDRSLRGWGQRWQWLCFEV